ncbi:MAG: hypothetical protein H6741_06615 [Alphaproteobacteria bacterium]|nr:hypothetical protein [Alphaproteobacteria bacterium]
MPLFALLIVACSPTPLEDPAREVWIAGEIAELSWTSDQGGDLLLVDPDGHALPLAEDLADAGSMELTVPLDAEGGRDFDLRMVSASGDATPISANLTLGALVGFTWNGVQEELFRLDPRTGTRFLLGVVGDMERWSGEVAVDYVHSTLYVWGVDASENEELHALDLFSGAYLGEVPVSTPVAGWQVNSLGELISLRWNGAVEELVRIDPTSGADTVIGVVGDLTTWGRQTAIDVSTDTLYVLGADPNERWFIYEMDAQNGTLLAKTPCPPGPLGVQLTSRGTLVYGMWDGAVEQLMELDPSSGAVTPLGIIGGLRWWSGQTALDVANDTLYVFGNDGQQEKLYVMDVSTGGLLYETALNEVVSAPRLVF